MVKVGQFFLSHIVLLIVNSIAMKYLICFILLTFGLSLAFPIYDEQYYYEFDEEEINKIAKNFAQMENISFDERTLEDELRTSETVPGSTFGPLLQLTICGLIVIVLFLFCVSFSCCCKNFRKKQQATKSESEAKIAEGAQDSENKSEKDVYIEVENNSNK